MKNKKTLFVLFCFIIYCCKGKQINKEITTIQQKDSSLIKKRTTIKETAFKVYELNSNINFKNLFKKDKEIKNADNKHGDFMTNKGAFLTSLFKVKFGSYKIETTAYEYKKNCVFYIHNLNSTSDSISIKSIIEKTQGKVNDPYMQERVLVFAMKNDNEANFIDIPVNWNSLGLKEELISKMYKEIKGDVILCDRNRKCIYKKIE